MKRVSTISNIDCVMPQVNSRWRCSNRCEAAKSWVEYPDHIFVDRIDIKIEMNNNDNIQLLGENLCENSRQVRERVTKCREIQADRFNNAGKHHINTNSQMDIKQIRRYCATSADAGRLLSFAGEKLKLSARGYTRVLKVARTIADLANSQLIETSHISEALHYREGEGLR